MIPRLSAVCLVLLLGCRRDPCKGWTVTVDRKVADSLREAISGDEVVDADGDGYPESEDCDDNDATANPSHPENCRSNDTGTWRGGDDTAWWNRSDTGWWYDNSYYNSPELCGAICRNLFHDGADNCWQTGERLSGRESWRCENTCYYRYYW